MTLNLSTQIEGGHSSAPGKETSITIIANAVLALSENPHRMRLSREQKETFRALAPETPFGMRMALSNLWITGPILKRVLANNPPVAAMLRTTTAPTVIRGGEKDNILPQTTEAKINYRIHPDDTTDEVIARARRLINDDRVIIEPPSVFEPQGYGSTTSDGYGLITRTIREKFGNITVVPTLLVATTDTRHYAKIAENSYRFSPVFADMEDLSRIHGTGERISLENLGHAVLYYETLIQQAGS